MIFCNTPKYGVVRGGLETSEELFMDTTIQAAIRSKSVHPGPIGKRK